MKHPDHLTWPVNFTPEEFSQSGGHHQEVLSAAIWDNLNCLAWSLQTLRSTLNSPVQIVSGYRTPKYNAMVGGAKHSQHMEGTAADIVCRDFTPGEVFQAIEGLQNQGDMNQGGLHAYSGFTHYDIRGVRARW